MKASIQLAAGLLERADAIVIAAGAGMGVDAELPEFHNTEGFWRAYPALAKSRTDFERVASSRSFRVDPRLAWGFYGHRLSLYRDAEPNEGFAILRRWSKRVQHGAFVFTSNVDGQFQKAGFGEDRVHECHGSIHTLQCIEPCCADIWPADSLQPRIDTRACRWLGELPVCPRCRGGLRPNMLMFDDGAWLESRVESQRQRLVTWLSRVRRPVVVELGAGTSLPTVRQFGHQVVRHHHGRLIRINPREPGVLDSHGVGIADGPLGALRAIDAAWAAKP